MKTKMKTTLLLLLFPLLLFLVAHADASDLKCSNKTEAELGKDVTLYCYCEPRCDVTGEVLKWKFNQKTTVLAYRGTYNLEHQDPQSNNVSQQADQFKGRANVSSIERLKDGNFSVTISEVRKSDEGNYTCRVENKTCSVELRFKVEKEDKQASGAQGDNIPPPPPTAGARGDNTTTTSGGSNNGAIIAIVAVVLVLVFAGALTYLIYRYRKSLLSCIGRQRGGERHGEEPKRGKYLRSRT